jgi:membrane-associated phospholipid phosphatase
LSEVISFRRRIEPWQGVVCLGVSAYLSLGAVTNSIRGYHWLMLAAVPGVLLSGERGRRFFVDWSPLFGFWLVYDRLRLIQPLLYARVAVAEPFLMERAAFGWLANGEVPAHAAHSWLASDMGLLAVAVAWIAQVVYFSHLFVAPLIMLVLWRLAASNKSYREVFARHIRAFTILNFSAIVIYLVMPVGPPWWVSLNEFAQPTTELVSQANLAGAMHGALIQGMIGNASQWFAAVPSLHGAYPVLLLLLGSWIRGRWFRVGIALYACAMWAATVVLNQHYIVDLLAGALLAIVAWCAVWLWKKKDCLRVAEKGESPALTVDS